VKGFYNIFQKQLLLGDGLPLPFHKDLDGNIHEDDLPAPPRRVSVEEFERDMQFLARRKTHAFPK
jgi:hypothetical protein